MTSKLDIWNKALAHLAMGLEIGSESEKSPEARACRRFYDEALDSTLKDFPWPFATKIKALTIATEQPNDEWDLEYHLPADCLAPRRVLSGVIPDNPDSQVPFRIVDGSPRSILTNKDEAELEYTAKMTQPGKYPADFVLALSLRLASYIAPVITGGDPFKLGDRSMKFYMLEIGKAQKNAANEEVQRIDTTNDLKRARQ